jgi:hypothetical protein
MRLSGNIVVAWLSPALEYVSLVNLSTLHVYQALGAAQLSEARLPPEMALMLLRGYGAGSAAGC